MPSKYTNFNIKFVFILIHLKRYAFLLHLFVGVHSNYHALYLLAFGRNSISKAPVWIANEIENEVGK